MIVWGSQVVKDGKTFLDIIAEQIKHTRKTFGSNVRFILMNSFSTRCAPDLESGARSADTLAHLKKTHPTPKRSARGQG